MVYLSSKNIKTTRPSKKLDWKQLGPFKIAKQISDVSYKLDLPHAMKTMHNVFHVSLLEPAKQNTIPNRVQSPPPPVEIDGQEEHEVAEVVDSKLDRRSRPPRVLYQVRWVGYEGTVEDSNINSNFYFCMSIDIPLISVLMSIYMEILLKIKHNLNASK